MDNEIQIGENILNLAKKAAKENFQNRIVAIYALGSLAHGGFASQVSDVDIAIILHSPIVTSDEETMQEIDKTIRKTNYSLSDRLSIFWGTIDSLNGNEPGGRFPPLDILDLIQFGRLLDGEDIRAKIRKPSLQELEIATTEFALKKFATQDIIQEFKEPYRIIEKGVRHVTKTILFPVRFLYTSFTGNIGQNDHAVSWYESKENTKAKELVSTGFYLRMHPLATSPKIEDLFKHYLEDLYKEFIDQYIKRMEAYKKEDLVQELITWKKQL